MSGTSELRQISRTLRRDWGFSLTVVLILALGLGLTSYMFGAINAYVLRPLPFPDPERLVHVEMAEPATGRMSLEVPLADFLELRREQRTVESLEAFYPGTVNLSEDRRPERYSGAFVTAGALSALGVAPRLGRLFLEGEDVPGAEGVAILGHDLWQGRYGGDPGVVGRVIRANGRERVVVGVMPQGFRFPIDEDLWLPLTLSAAAPETTFEVFGRLRSGESLEGARSDLHALVQRLYETRPEEGERVAVVKPYAREYVGEETRRVLLAMFAAVAFVLLIACANAANLITARSVARARELAIRSALGAGRWRLAARTVAESGLLTVVAAALGWVTASRAGSFTFSVLRAGDDVPPPYWVQFAPDWRDLAFLSVAAFVTATLASLAPALRAVRGDLTAPMRSGGTVVAKGGAGRFSPYLVAGQMALCCVLLTGAGLMARTVLALRSVNLGADVSGVLTARIGLFEEDFPTEAERVSFFETLRERLEGLPGAEAVTVSTSLPGTFVGGDFYLLRGALAEDGGRLPVTSVAVVADNYFSTFRIPLLAGRAFDDTDRAETLPVALVNRLFAERAWPGEDAVGREVRLGRGEEERPWRTVVGVVPDVLQDEVDDPQEPTVYLPLTQMAPRFASVALRAAGDPMLLAEPLRRAVTAIAPDQPVYWVRTLDEWIRRGRFGTDFVASLFAVFAAAGFALAAAGLYAVLAYRVAQRAREIALRRALGAQDRGITRLVLRQGLVQAGLGVALGVPLAVAFGRLLSGQLVGVESFDLLTLGTVLATLGVVAGLAAVVPVRRALGVDPLPLLRSE